MRKCLIVPFVVVVFGFFLVACEKTFQESLAGTWSSTGFIGDERINSTSFEMQLVITKSGSVSVIAVDRSGPTPKIERSSGKIEGEYIVLDGQEFGKIEIDEKVLKLNDIKRNKIARFKRIAS